MQFRYLGQEDPLEEGIATHSSILAWRIPWTEEPLWPVAHQATVHGIAMLSLMYLFPIIVNIP